MPKVNVVTSGVEAKREQWCARWGSVSEKFYHEIPTDGYKFEFSSREMAAGFCGTIRKLIPAAAEEWAGLENKEEIGKVLFNEPLFFEFVGW